MRSKNFFTYGFRFVGKTGGAENALFPSEFCPKLVLTCKHK
jgi:hypothetical protein